MTETDSTAPRAPFVFDINDLKYAPGMCRIARTEMLTPKMRRITFTGPALQTLRYAVPSHTIRLFFINPDVDDATLDALERELGEMAAVGLSGHNALSEVAISRHYTFRRFDPDALEIDVDFVLHRSHGVAANWAAHAQEGDRIGYDATVNQLVRTPRDVDADWYLLVGDETSTPAIGTILESLPTGARAVALIEVEDAAEEQHLVSDADVTVQWVHRDGKTPGVAADAIRSIEWPSGRPFAWVAGETKMVAGVRRYIREERGLVRDDYEVQGYWRLGMDFDKRNEAVIAAISKGADITDFVEEELESL